MTTAGSSGLLIELEGKPERKFWWKLLKSPGQSLMSRKERFSLRTSLGCQRRGTTLSIKGGWFLAWTSLPFLPLSNGLHVQLVEIRKPVSKNLNSYFIKPLQNTKTQIILLADCSNSVTEREWRKLWLLGQTDIFGYNHHVKKQQCLNGRQYLLDIKRLSCPRKEKHQSPADSAKPIERVGLRHTWGTHPVDPLMMGDMGGCQGAGGPG